MPTLTTEVTTTVDVEFEVYCTCGNGMCGATQTRESYTRRYPQVVVEACTRCIEDAIDCATEKVREEMQARIDELEEKLREYTNG